MKEIFRLSKFLNKFGKNFQSISRMTLIKSHKIDYLKRLTKRL